MSKLLVKSWMLLTLKQCVFLEGSMLYVSSLFFSNLSKVKHIEVSPTFLDFDLLKKYIYSAVCFQVLQAQHSSSHRIYMPNLLLRLLYSTMKNILLQVAGTWFATWFYAMHRVFCQNPAFKLKIQTLILPVSQKMIKLKMPSKIFRMRFIGRQFIVSFVLCFLSWKLWGIVTLTSLQWTKSSSCCSKQMNQCLTHNKFLMMRTCLDQWREWVLSDCKQELDIYRRNKCRKEQQVIEVRSFLFEKNFQFNLNLFLSFFNDKDEDDGFTLG